MDGPWVGIGAMTTTMKAILFFVVVSIPFVWAAIASTFLPIIIVGPVLLVLSLVCGVIAGNIVLS